jgi:hypothetical protein
MQRSKAVHITKKYMFTCQGEARDPPGRRDIERDRRRWKSWLVVGVGIGMRGACGFQSVTDGCLGLLGSLYAISVDQLARVIGRNHRTGGGCGIVGAQAGWVESRRLTRIGPVAASKKPRVDRYPAAADVRILLEREL